MKKYWCRWQGLVYAGEYWGYSKRDVEKRVREQWGMVGKHINFECWLA